MDLGVLLFSSMSNQAEMYLSREIESKEIGTKNNSETLKTRISKFINYKKGAIKRNIAKSDLLENEIEEAIEELKNPDHKNILNEPAPKKDFQFNISKYVAKTNEITSGIIQGVKNLYQMFIGYAKSSYRAKEKKIFRYGFGQKKTVMGINLPGMSEMDHYTNTFKIRIIYKTILERLNCRRIDVSFYNM